MIDKIPLGISACLLGENVRFDGGHKRLLFAVEELLPYVTYTPVCPEVAIGLPVPRPALRLIQRGEDIRLCFSKQHDVDVTEKMEQFSRHKVKQLDTLCGYIVCANSPSCGMERVRVYTEQQTGSMKNGIGLFTRQLQQHLPWLPVEENGRLLDSAIRENFVTRIFALHELQQLQQQKLTRKKLIDFHSRYKLLLLAHHQAGYRELGRFVATISTYSSLAQFVVEYRLRLMTLLKHKATRRNHTNVLNHIQGYFKHYLSPRQRQELTSVIEQYRQGLLPLQGPLTLLKHYMAEYPEDYLSQQRYFSPFPDKLRLSNGD
ncbi:MAG: YbgA family protein [Enterobacteriaceae bacterium]